MDVSYTCLDTVLKSSPELRNKLYSKFPDKLSSYDFLISQHMDEDERFQMGEKRQEFNKFIPFLSSLEIKEYVSNSGKNISQLTNYYSSFEYNGGCGIDLKEATLNQLKNLKPTGTNKYLRDSDGVIDYHCLKDVTEYFNKALYSLLCYKHLQKGGYFSWSMVTFYYPRFYLNVALCRLQGNSFFYDGKPIQMIRADWNHHIYAIRKPKMKGPHVHIWEMAKECYKNFDTSRLSSVNNRDIQSFFDDEYYKNFGLNGTGRQELEWRNSITYGATKFDELFYAKGYNIPVQRAFYEGEMNFIDEDVFNSVASTEDFDGTGVEECAMGKLIEFVMEMMGKIRAEIDYNLCFIRMDNLRLLKTNADTFDTIESWVHKYGLND
jgi:hypothetical protein